MPLLQVPPEELARDVEDASPLDPLHFRATARVLAHLHLKRSRGLVQIGAIEEGSALDQREYDLGVALVAGPGKQNDPRRRRQGSRCIGRRLRDHERVAVRILHTELAVRQIVGYSIAPAATPFANSRLRRDVKSAAYR